MSPDMPATQNHRSDFPAVLLAALTAFGTGATFVYILFGLPGITRFREQAQEMGVLLIPAAAALTMMIVLHTTRKTFNGYAVTAAGAFAGSWGITFLDDMAGGPDMTGVWLALIAIGGGAALAGLAKACAGGTGQKIAIAIGFTVGFALNGKVTDLWSTRDLPPSHLVLALITSAIATVAAIIMRQETARFEVGPGVGTAALVGPAAVLVMAALLIRSSLVDDFGRVRGLANTGDPEMITYSLLGVAALVTVMLAGVAARLGGPRAASLPVLGFGLAAPMTPVALGFSSVSPTGWPVVVGGVVLAAALGAFAMLSYDLPWEVFGVLAAGGGLLLISVSAGATTHAEYLLMVCGGSFALAAGLVRAAGLCAGATAAALGLATMMLVAQALGPSTLEALRLNLLARGDQHAVLPSAIAAVALVVLFALSRAERGTR